MAKHYEDERSGITATANGEQGEAFLDKLQEVDRKMERAKNGRHKHLKEKGVVAVHPLDGNVEVADGSPSTKEAQVVEVVMNYPDVLDWRSYKEEGSKVALEYSRGREWTARVGRVVEVNDGTLGPRLTVEMLYKVKFDDDGNTIR